MAIDCIFYVLLIFVFWYYQFTENIVLKFLKNDLQFFLYFESL